MQLIYINHSGFAILGENITIIMDYYIDSDKNPKQGVVHSQLLARPGRFYILSSHSHPDHFNPEVLNWKEQGADCIYLFSSEIQDTLHLKEKGIHYLNKLETYQDENIEVKAFGSTDIGGSFLIRVAGKIIFHAGDLNNWHWNEESTAEEIKEAENYFEEELSLLAHEVSYLDLAMFPIDPNLGKDYMKGAEQFISSIKTTIFAPMHFHAKYDKISLFEEIAQKYNCTSINWKDTNESINF